MSIAHTIKYEIIARARVRRMSGGPENHALKLLYRGGGTPWWTCNSSLDLVIPEDFEGEPGQYLNLTVTLIQ